jgi:hypothetical protein
MTYVRVVNIIPLDYSEEYNLDWQPSIAVNPINPNQIAIVALTPPEIAVQNWPIFYSNDGGETWQMNFNVPGELWDQSAGFCAPPGELYRAIATGASVSSNGIAIPHAPQMFVVRTPDPAAPGALPQLDPRQNIDQPYLRTARGAALSAKQQLYVGYNDHSHEPQSATVDVCLDALAAAPTFAQIRLDPRSPDPCDGYEVRPVAHNDGTVYVAYKSWRSWDKPNSTVRTHIVVARDNTWGAGGFVDLKDANDSKAGQIVAANVRILDPQYLAGQRLNNDLDIAVDPNNSSTVYVVWGDNSGPNYTLRLRRSLNAGQSWSDDLLNVDNANLAGLAINSVGRVGFVYQQLMLGRWEMHFRRTTDNTGKNWDDILLARTATTGLLGDYSRVIAVDQDFFGVFPAWNTPDPANFPATPSTALTPNGAKYLRKTTQNAPWQLLGLGGQVIQGSVDPFFFKVQQDTPPDAPTGLTAVPN